MSITSTKDNSIKLSLLSITKSYCLVFNFTNNWILIYLFWKFLAHRPTTIWNSNLLGSIFITLKNSIFSWKASSYNQNILIFKFRIIFYFDWMKQFSWKSIEPLEIWYIWFCKMSWGYNNIIKYLKSILFILTVLNLNFKSL